MNIEFSKTIHFGLLQSDTKVLNDAMVILDKCSYDCRNQAELTEDLALKETLKDCAADFESAYNRIENVLFMVKDGVQV